MRCVIICGSPDTDIAFVQGQIRPDDFIICADSGYLTAKQLGIIPDILVGDFDSYTGELPRNREIRVVSLNPRKDQTDTFQCAYEGMQAGLRDFVLLGALGGRLDHVMGNLAVMAYLVQNHCSVQMLSSQETVRLLPEGIHRVSGVCGKTFSVVPFGCGQITVTYQEHVAYPLEHYTVTAGVTIGISNIFTGDVCDLQIHEGQALVIINNNPVR